MLSITLEQTTIRFAKLTLADELEWSEWLRSTLMAEAFETTKQLKMQPGAAAAFLAQMQVQIGGGRSDLLTVLGLTHLQTPSGTRKLLEIASRTHHPSPHIDEETLNRLFRERMTEVQEVLKSIMPMKGDSEKKQTAGQTDGQR